MIHVDADALLYRHLNIADQFQGIEALDGMCVLDLIFRHPSKLR